MKKQVKNHYYYLGHFLKVFHKGLALIFKCDSHHLLLLESPCLYHQLYH